MTRTLQSDGLYRDDRGNFWIRPTLHGKRTWRRLASLTLADARQESAALVSDHARSKLGLAADPFDPAPPTVAEAAARLGRTLPPRILRAFGSVGLRDIRMHAAMEWAKNMTGTRAADTELSALSAVCRDAVMRGWLVANPLAGRPRLHTIKRHSREVMPLDGDELHAMARRFFDEPRSRAIGWQMLIAALTGCRTNEVLSLRMDALGRQDPGCVEGRYLYVRRSKSGVFPFVELTPELRACIEAHHAWHAAEVGASRWWFPGADLFRPLSRSALTDALARVGGRKITAHGLRAYCVTVWRSRGETNEQVASRIGDRTSSLIETTYGALPVSWAGGEPLTWLPTKGEPAWAGWGSVVPDNVIAI